MDTGLDKLYAEFGNLFADCFGVRDSGVLSTVNATGHQLAGYFTLVDHLVDGDVDRHIGAVEATRRVVGGFKDLSLVIGDHHLFWSCFDPAVTRWLAAFELESDYRAGRLTTRAFGISQMHQLAADRGCVAVGTPALLASCSSAADRRDRLDVIARSIDAYSVAQQLRDDVVDWRDDLRGRRPNFVLVALSELVDTGSTPVDELARVVHREGVGLQLLRDAVARSTQAQAMVADVAPAWARVLGASASRLTEALHYIESLPPPAPAHRGSVRLTISLDRATFPDERTISGLRKLLEEWQSGRTLRHVMVFPGDSGVTCPGVYVGDVFSRAMAMNCLRGVDDSGDGAFDAFLQLEAARLEGRRDPTGETLWRYFPGFDDLSPDLDTFAEVGTALLGTRRMTAELRALHTRVADRVLERARETGVLETWFFTDTASRPAELAAASALWGRGEDPEVAANFLWFLLRLDEPRFAPAVAELAGRIFGGDRPVPRSTWYTDCGYHEYVVARLLVGLNPVRWRATLVETLDRARDRWRSAPETALRHYRTAFFLLTRDVLAQAGIAFEDDVDAAERAREWLAERCAADALPTEESFIHMDLSRTGRLDGEIFFASGILQRAFGLLALTRPAPGATDPVTSAAAEALVP